MTRPAIVTIGPKRQQFEQMSSETMRAKETGAEGAILPFLRRITLRRSAGQGEDGCDADDNCHYP